MTTQSSQSATAPTGVTLRPATIRDVPSIALIINSEAEIGTMLPRSFAALYENIREFQVATIAHPAAESGERVIGVCGLSIIWANLAEVCALAVDPSFRGQGIGKALVKACMAESHALQIRKIMTLTYEQGFFASLGFTVVDRQQLPLKVWSECVRCPKNQACDEIAMIYIHEDLPVYDGPAPGDPPPSKYVIPVVPRRNR